LHSLCFQEWDIKTMAYFEVSFNQEQWSRCFFSQSFKKNEFITCYLGEFDENPSDETYVFKKINGVPVKSAPGLLEDYWFGHQIQHGSSNQVNVTITSGYIIKASRDIETGEELFMDYKRSLFCGKCKDETVIFVMNVPRSLRSAIFVEIYASTLKSVIIAVLL